MLALIIYAFLFVMSALVLFPLLASLSIALQGPTVSPALVPTSKA